MDRTAGTHRLKAWRRYGDQRVGLPAPEGKSRGRRIAPQKGCFKGFAWSGMLGLAVGGREASYPMPITPVFAAGFGWKNSW